MEYFVRSFTTQRMFKPEVNNTSDNFIVLTSDNWNDFGYETCFSIDLFQQNEFKEIGNIRILHVDKEKTRYVIPKEFSSLSKEYVSLGMDQEFYISLIDVLGKEEALSVLNDLNDIAISGLENNPNFDIDSEGIQQSFFRSSDGRYLYREVSNTYFENQQSSDWDYKFTFEFEVDEDEYTPIDIDFLKYDKLPNRLFALIGKNGVGKTRFLNELSKALYDSSNPDNKSRFYSNEIPAYHKIIAISFSVFDHFFKGEYEERNRNVETKQANYTYIGLHKIDNTVYTSEELVDINISTFKQLISKNRNERFVELLNMSNILSKEFKNKDIDDAFFKENYSSGQKIFISMLCRLLLEIEDGSLIFLDEPELFLHPNAIASLMNIFSDILTEYQSYAILCTHSPILVQEIPSRYVRNLSLVGGDLIQTEIAIETFGANVSDIIKDVYNVKEHESLYKTTLIKLAKEMSEKEIEALFNDELSLKARMFLSSLFVGGE